MEVRRRLQKKPLLLLLVQVLPLLLFRLLLLVLRALVLLRQKVLLLVVSWMGAGRTCRPSGCWRCRVQNRRGRPNEVPAAEPELRSAACEWQWGEMQVASDEASLVCSRLEACCWRCDKLCNSTALATVAR